MRIAGWAARPATAKLLLELNLRNAQSGDIVSVKSAIELIRHLAPYLRDTDDELTADIVEVAIGNGLFVCFDCRE
ncbi:hypothetical protein [Mesorhizobium sp. dw_380]|uniref:hypothetical protein n=1 Tax=Mesorhizobium sp. dw_380 TaxID=2812001 RepID=UPI001BDF530D|nr:hypothetical protein [Mesorhizobium sp. dw_380]